MDRRTGRHGVFVWHAHLGAVAQYRGNVLTPAVLERLEAIGRGVCRRFDVALKALNGEQDHVPLLVNYPPKVQLSKRVNSLKGASSRRLKAEFPALAKHGVCKRSGSL